MRKSVCFAAALWPEEVHMLVDAVDAEFQGESWHVSPRCNEYDDPRDAYVDPDNLREMRNDPWSAHHGMARSLAQSALSS